MWNYIFFIGYLDWKDSNEYTGIETYVHEKLKNNDSGWFPFGKARELMEFEEQGADDLNLAKSMN